MNQYEKRHKAINEEIGKHADAYKEVIDKAEAENRQPDEDDRKAISEHTVAIETLKKERAEVEANIETLKDVEDLSRNLGPQFSDFGSDVQVAERHTPAQVKSLGEQFIESKGYKGLMEQGLSGHEFSSGPIELDTKATLTSTPGSVLQPTEYQPGIVETLYQRLYVADLCGSASTTASMITYVSETTATNAAAATSEGAAKPESTLIFGETQEPVRKLATILPVTDEMLEDAPQISGYINQRLTLFIKQVEETQLLSGTGTAPQISGFLDRSINTYARGTVDDNATALFKAMNGTRGSAQLDMDGIVIHPNNWQAIRIAKDTGGQFYGGGPFYGPYGGPQGPSSASQFSADNLWGVRVVVTSSITANTALVGAFNTASAVFRRSGVTVEATNSHSTYFATNITALRAEERLALAVYRPGAFTQVTGLS